MPEYPAVTAGAGPNGLDAAIPVSVVIPHYQDLDNLGRCLALLEA